jgi:putative spermidine/putrescine transport system ATP-binding protein
MAEIDPSIAFRGVRKVYGDGTVAVEDLTLDIGKGEFFSLLGPSGCGKTTTLRMIAGFEEPTAGRLSIDGRDVTHVPPNRRDTGMVFQSYALFPHRTVFQNVAFGLRMRKVAKAAIAERVERALALVELEALGGRYPDQLSGGQQQRVALARAIVIEPKVLLMDEPLGALDKKLRRTMQFELKELQRKIGVTLVYVTHDQEEALTMSDRIAVMNAGRVEQVGRPETIYGAPATPFVSDFIGESNLFAGTAETDGGGTWLRLPDGGRLPLPRSHRLDGAPVTMAVRPERIRLTDDPSADGAWIGGMVADANFLGATRLIKVVTAAGDTVLVREAADGRAALPPGRSVGLSWPAEAGVILDEPPSP